MGGKCVRINYLIADLLRTVVRVHHDDNALDCATVSDERYADVPSLLSSTKV